MAFEDALDDGFVPFSAFGGEILVLEDEAVFGGDGVFGAGEFCVEIVVFWVFYYVIQLSDKKLFGWGRGGGRTAR